MNHRAGVSLGIALVLVSNSWLAVTPVLTSCASTCQPPHTLVAGDMVGNSALSANEFNPTVHRYQHVEFTCHYLISEDKGPTFQWTAPPGAAIVGTPGASSVAIRLGDKGGPVCVKAVSACGESNTLCRDVVIDPQPWWTALDDFPGGARFNMTPSFTIGHKGYIGAGTEKYTANTTDWWEFDFDTFRWTEKKMIPDYGVVGGAYGGQFQGFQLGSRIFLVTNQGHLWEYLPAYDAWEARAGYPGSIPDSPRFFGAGGMGVAGPPTWPSFEPMREVWVYDPAANKWTRKGDFPGSESGIPQGGVAFQIGDRGFLGWGEDRFHTKLSTIWEYVPATDTWTTAGTPTFLTTHYLTTFKGRALFAVDGGIKAWSPDGGLDTFISHPFLGELPGCMASDKFALEIGGTQGLPGINSFVFLYNE